MTEHEIKSWRKPFQARLDGLKPFEFRRDDRDYKVGDTLWEREWNHHQEEYTGREIRGTRIISKWSKGFGILEGYCILGVEAKLEKAQALQIQKLREALKRVAAEKCLTRARPAKDRPLRECAEECIALCFVCECREVLSETQDAEKEVKRIEDKAQAEVWEKVIRRHWSWRYHAIDSDKAIHTSAIEAFEKLSALSRQEAE